MDATDSIEAREGRLKVYLETSFYWRPDMSDTALVDEVRAARHRIAAECGNDPAKIAARAAEAARRFLAHNND